VRPQATATFRINPDDLSEWVTFPTLDELVPLGRPVVSPLPERPIPLRYTRQVGEQPEPAPVSVVGCPYCQRVPCEDNAHRLWKLGLNGVDA
jgi:hypothetical protein